MFGRNSGASEALMAGRTRGSRSAGKNPGNENSRLQGRGENNLLMVDEMMNLMNQTAAVWNREHSKSKSR